jgi:predicted membrane-bound spermidine synthase
MTRYLYFVVFASGMTTLALELTASRLLGSVFGTSNLVWASIIGLILIYLTAGYFLGGWWADRSPEYKTLYTILAWGAFLCGAVPLAARPVLRLAADAFDQLQLAVLFGSFVAVLVLFSLPVTLLGTVSPFAIRLAIKTPQEAGRVSGRVYAISTFGSFIGTFLPVLVAIPLMGTALTFLAFSLFLALVGLGGLWLSAGWRVAVKLIWMPLLLLLAMFLAPRIAIKQTSGQIYETESAYNYIQVLEQDGYRMLRLNEGQGVHSMWHPTEIDFNGPWEQFLAAPFFNPAPYGPEKVKNMAILGLAGGTTASQATRAFGPVSIDGFELDPAIIAVGREYFDMNEPNLRAIAQDGRWGLANSQQRYTIIGVDAYQPPYIPWHMTTREFFQVVRDHLTDDGVMVINVGRSLTDRSLVDSLASTIGAVFPSVYVMDVPDSLNSIIYASRQPTDIRNLYENYMYLESRPETHPLLMAALERLIVFQQPTPSGGLVFSDDWAPVEWLTNRMILSFVLLGDVEDLRP